MGNDNWAFINHFANKFIILKRNFFKFLKVLYFVSSNLVSSQIKVWMPLIMISKTYSKYIKIAFGIYRKSFPSISNIRNGFIVKRFHSKTGRIYNDFH